MNDISVIMPARNAAAWIDAALASVLEQGDCVLEVLVVNDASTDDTVACVRTWAARDARIRLLENPQQRGVSASRNVALRAACGEWIALMDADDLMQRGRLTSLLAAARSTGADVVADNLAYFPDGSMTTLRSLFETRDMPTAGVCLTTLSYLRQSSPDRADGLGLLNPMIRRDFLQQHRIFFREEVRSSEDFVFNLELLLAGADFRLLPEAMYHYRVHQTSALARERGVSRLDVLVQVLRELADACAARGDALIATTLRDWCEKTERVQKPLLQLRARFLRGERLGPALHFLRTPVLWLPVLARVLAWFRRRWPGTSER